MTIGPKELPLAQPTQPFTHAWNVLYGRRNATETVNSLLKGGFVDIDRGFIKQLATRNIKFYFAFTPVGVNAHILNNWDDHPETESVDLLSQPVKNGAALTRSQSFRPTIQRVAGASKN